MAWTPCAPNSSGAMPGFPMHFLQTPCVTIRNETEWVETLSSKANTLVKADANEIFFQWECALENEKGFKEGLYGDGNASEKIASILSDYFK